MGKDAETYISYLASRISHDVRMWKDNNLAKYGVTLSQVMVLDCLWEKDGLTQTEVSRILNIKPSSLSALVDILMEKGFLKRVDDAEDARIKRLYLTESGQSLKDDACGDLLGFEKRITHNFAPEERALLVMWLQKIIRNIEEIENK